MVDWKKIRDKEQEIVLKKAQIPLAAYRHKHFPSLITALEDQEKRIEFLEKALEQAVNVSNLERGVTSVSVSVDVPESFVSDGSGSVENLFPAEAFPELAKYLEEKNV